VTRDPAGLVAANEALAREVNEAIERGQWPGEQHERAAFRCECARPDCNRLVEISGSTLDGERFILEATSEDRRPVARRPLIVVFRALAAELRRSS
jgi:hypothetical protein